MLKRTSYIYSYLDEDDRPRRDLPSHPIKSSGLTSERRWALSPSATTRRVPVGQGGVDYIERWRQGSSTISAGDSTAGTSRSKNLSTVSFGASQFKRSGVCSKFPTRVKILTASRLPARVCCSEGMAARDGKKN